MRVFWPFIAIGVLSVVEFFLARSWARLYYVLGLPIFRMRLDHIRLGADAEQRIATVAERNASMIVYHRLSESEIAFREKGRSSPTFRYTPILHGLLRYAPEEGATYLTGFVNYWTIAATALMIYLFASSSRYHRPWELVIFFALLFGIMYAIGVWRYRMVAKALRATGAETSPQSLPAQ